jgi:hypothetical protein
MPTISAHSPTSAQHLAMEQDLSEVFGVHPSTEGERFDHADVDLPFDLDDAEVERLRAATQSAARWAAAGLGPMCLLVGFNGMLLC